MPLNFPYYYGHAGEQYAFFRIPKLLITDSRFDGVSSDAKLLYGLLLDRMELSYRNGWVRCRLKHDAVVIERNVKWNESRSTILPQ